MVISLVCGALVLVALVCSYRWRSVEALQPDPPVGRAERLVRWVWWVQLLLLTAVTTGVLVVGAGGRLAMRLLAATAGDTAQRRITEADEVVGKVTVDGTVSFVMFVGLFAGLLSAGLWFGLRRLLPPRWLGGLLFGAALLVVLGTRNEPLRPGNEDFDLVGPWWVAVLAFAALALAQGVAVATFAARLSRWLPLPGRNLRSLTYVLLLLLVPIFPLGLAAVAGGLAYVFAGPLLERARRWLTAPTPTRIAQAALAVVVLVAAPGFVLALSDLVGRGPA